ncbi:HDOD domain-containing protein [Idiomarina seosinensis]|uniref:Phosphohydrolase n=1 Tax=Idiomarina seosinensis TaxID=281739 RepID=A0A432Z759_9GAMM|nr:HDOD domain-containing protein [Idiomarina seosinensis]RUO73731.1 phosphohydrolase [Idiomarina seosinensis]
MYDFFAVSTEGGSQDPAERLEKRFINYLISFPFARKSRDKADGKGDEELEQKRRLLQVEQINHDERERMKKARQRYQDRVSEELHEAIYYRILERIEDSEYVRERLIPLPENLPELLDLLSTRAASMRRVENIVQGMDWFHNGVLKTVNQPPFIDKRRKEKQVKLESLRTAMSFMGAENLRILTPSYIVQHWLPPSTAPFMLFRRKVWEHSLGTAVLAHEIAISQGLKDPVLAYTIGMFHELGKIALTKLYLRVFDDMQREMAMKSIKDSTPDKHNALVELKPDERFLRNLMLEQDKKVSYLVAEGWGLQRVPISKHLLSYTQAKSAEDYTNYAKVLGQANAFCEYRLLRDVDLASVEEGLQLLKKHDVDANLASKLNNVNLKRPKVIVPN